MVLYGKGKHFQPEITWNKTPCKESKAKKAKQQQQSVTQPKHKHNKKGFLQITNSRKKIKSIKYFENNTIFSESH